MTRGQDTARQAGELLGHLLLRHGGRLGDRLRDAARHRRTGMVPPAAVLDPATAIVLPSGWVAAEVVTLDGQRWPWLVKPTDQP